MPTATAFGNVSRLLFGVAPSDHEMYFVIMCVFYWKSFNVSTDFLNEIIAMRISESFHTVLTIKERKLKEKSPSVYWGQVRFGAA
jgi:hypothetical protein